VGGARPEECHSIPFFLDTLMRWGEAPGGGGGGGGQEGKIIKSVFVLIEDA
jgi:hypothetical protein